MIHQAGLLQRQSSLLQLIPSPGALLWSDEFNGIAGTPPNSANWDYQIGRFGASSGENQYYTNSTTNCMLDGNSNLAIIVKNETPPDSAVAPNNFTSARLTSKTKVAFSPTVGNPIRMASRIKVPFTKGLLPAFWTVGSPDDWPHAGEIDIMEQPSHGGGNSLAMNLHGPTNGAPAVDKNLGRSYLYTDLYKNDFHIFGVDWYVDQIIWHLDGVVRGQATQSQYVAINGDWAPFGGSWTHFFLLNIAVGNDWTGDPDGTSIWPQTMLIDWVRVWSL